MGTYSDYPAAKVDLPGQEEQWARESAIARVFEGGFTEDDARVLGYTLTRGAYTGTSDDRSDRWYVVDTASDVVDRRGAGHVTKTDALEAVRDFISNRLAHD